MFVLGLTGSIAGGKSTVARLLEEHGVPRIDADAIAKRVIEEPHVLAKLTERFGSQIISPDGKIDRSKLGRIVFGHQNNTRSQRALVYLESVVHPIVRQRIDAELRDLTHQNLPCVVLDIPLLYESGWDRSCDSIWCVDANFEVRKSRVASRGWTPEELQRREANQWSLIDKRRRSNWVINNNGSLDQLTSQISQACTDLLPRLSISLATDAHCR